MKNQFLSNPESIKNWLKTYKIHDAVLVPHNEYGFVVDALSCVDLSNKALSDIPIKFNRVEGDLLVNHNQLENLEFAPFYVGGDFCCESNNLMSLAGCPQNIGKNFNCSHNSLINLIEGPKTVGADYVAYDCLLINLEGVPATIEGSLKISHNGLTTLRYSPFEIKKDFICENNELETLEFGPQIVGQRYLAGENRLKTLEFIPIQSTPYFSLEGNHRLKGLQKLNWYEQLYIHHLQHKEAAEIKKTKALLEKNIATHENTTGTRPSKKI